MTLGVVVPCYRQERYLPRTIAAIEQALGGNDWRGVLVIADASANALPALSPRWTLLTPSPGTLGTPGASRMLGFAAVSGEWVLFVDADTEIDADWLTRALAERSSDDEVAGYGGRIRERVSDGEHDWDGEPDLNRVGDRERFVDLLTTPALYRRVALLEVGGYDPRLNAEEDFELGLRFAEAGWSLRLLRGPAARHWNGPRPSFAELSRRWRNGLSFGPGQALRLYLGRPGFFALLRRQWLPLATLLFWAWGVLTSARYLATRDSGGLVLWICTLAFALVALCARKRSFKRGVFALLSWTLNGAGVVVGFVRSPRASVSLASGRA